MATNELTFVVLTLLILLTIDFYAVHRKTETVTVGVAGFYLCPHNLNYIILL